ncbi:unnamed protein product [Rhodiola kirilowii]
MPDIQFQTRFGIIGCASIARKVSRAILLSPSSTLHAVASRSLEKAKTFVAENGLPDSVKIYGSYEQLLDDPSVDAVYMPLPTSLHLHWAVLAARKGKHLLLEKPTALDASELDLILEACDSNGVQFMDGSMWLHHPRTARMKEMISDQGLFGRVNNIYSTSTFSEPEDFFETNIRVKPDLDSLGALGDIGWYCIGSILWATDYQPPHTVLALPDITKNSHGVILSCSASFHWNNKEDTKTAIFHCSYLSNVSMDLAVSSSTGSVHVDDYIIPVKEPSAEFEVVYGAQFANLHIGWNKKPSVVEVFTDLPQEALMVEEFSRLVERIRNSGGRPDRKWPEISRKTQVVIDAVRKSIELGCKLVTL